MTTLTGPSAPAQSGTTRSLVILLHGYGANGDDLFGLRDPLKDYMPDTAFHAPNAPQPCAANPMGYQWFPIPRLDGSSEAESAEAFARSVAILDRYVEQTMAAEGVTPAQTVLVGFSQGTMMSLHIAPRRAEPLAGIVGFSGRLIDKTMTGPEILSRPPVLLVHGDSDEMIGVHEMSEAETALRAGGFEVSSHICRGLGHSIDMQGLTLALRFMVDKLGIDLG